MAKCSAVWVSETDTRVQWSRMRSFFFEMSAVLLGIVVVLSVVARPSLGAGDDFKVQSPPSAFTL